MSFEQMNVGGPFYKCTCTCTVQQLSLITFLLPGNTSVLQRGVLSTGPRRVSSLLLLLLPVATDTRFTSDGLTLEAEQRENGQPDPTCNTVQCQEKY